MMIYLKKLNPKQNDYTCLAKILTSELFLKHTLLLNSLLNTEDTEA